MTTQGQYRRKELGWVWNNGRDEVYHSFNNFCDLGDYPSLDAAKRACETCFEERAPCSADERPTALASFAALRVGLQQNE